jgi:hypothetical protein
MVLGGHTLNAQSCPYCPDKPVMVCIADDLYECPECAYEENTQDVESTASKIAKTLMAAGLYDAEVKDEMFR